MFSNNSKASFVSRSAEENMSSLSTSYSVPFKKRGRRRWGRHKKVIIIPSIDYFFYALIETSKRLCLKKDLINTVA